MTDENQNGIDEIPKEFEKSNDEDENNIEDDFDSRFSANTSNII